MGSTSSKSIGRAEIENETETNGGFHIVEVNNHNPGDNLDYFCGTDFYNYFYLPYPIRQIHGATATYGLVSCVVLAILIYGTWRSCRRCLLKERNNNIAASFQLQQSPTSRIPLFSRSQQELPPAYPTTSTGTEPLQPKYDIDRMIKSLV